MAGVPNGWARRVADATKEIKKTEKKKDPAKGPAKNGK